jgi:hypothetical protein
MLRYCVGLVSDFQKKNIKLDKERKSKDGLKTLKHIESLNDTEFEAVRFDKNFVFLSDDNITTLMATSEWTTADKP